MKLELLTTSFGIELAPKFTSNIKALASANFDACTSLFIQYRSNRLIVISIQKKDKVKVAAAAPVYLERSILAKSVPDFWLKSLDNCNQLAPQIAASDRECLKHLVDVQIIHQADPRDFSLTFVSFYSFLIELLFLSMKVFFRLNCFSFVHSIKRRLIQHL